MSASAPFSTCSLPRPPVHLPLAGSRHWKGRPCTDANTPDPAWHPAWLFPTTGDPNQRGKPGRQGAGTHLLVLSPATHAAAPHSPWPEWGMCGIGLLPPPINWGQQWQGKILPSSPASCLVSWIFPISPGLNPCL